MCLLLQQVRTACDKAASVTRHHITDVAAELHAKLSYRSKDWKARLREYGLSGVLAYGMLNTIYYTATFWYMWTHVYKVPRGMSRNFPSTGSLLY